jgi:hypothetical protein
MNKYLLLALCLAASSVYADEAKNEWQNTSLSDAVIEKIQVAKYGYKKCVSDEMQKSGYQKIDTRNATDAIMKQCETILAKMREVYTEADVPEVIADRHLKQMRMQTTREVLQGMMFSAASRKVPGQ